MAVQGGLSVLAALIVFPESVGHQFQSHFAAIVQPLVEALTLVEGLFAEASILDGDDAYQRLDQWAERSKHIRSELLKSLAGIPPCRAQQHYLVVDFSYSRLSGADLRDIFDRLASSQSRSAGLSFFFDIIVTNARHTHIDSSIFTAREASSRPTTRPPSPTETPEADQEESPVEGHTHRHFPFLRRHGSPTGYHKGSHLSLLDHLRKIQQPVGVYESQRYMDIEKAYSLYVIVFDFADFMPETLSPSSDSLIYWRRWLCLWFVLAESLFRRLKPGYAISITLSA